MSKFDGITGLSMSKADEFGKGLGGRLARCLTEFLSAGDGLAVISRMDVMWDGVTIGKKN